MSLQNKSKNKKVAVALSGGVDSSVAAALLKKQGFDVIGFHLRFWKAKENKSKNKEVEDRVKKIGEVLAIPIKFFDVKENFKKLVEDYFLKEMKNGRTPNTCVVCNREIKFKFLLAKAKELNCDYLATGHYARIKHYQLQILDGEQSRTTTNYKLLRAKDLNKDQTYFLWGLKLTPQQWSKILFPIGEIENKQKVRQIAKVFGLPTFQTPSSSDVCFLGSLDFNSFLQKKLGKKKGNIVDKQGNILGEHQGLWFYTIGQRKGINIPVKKGKTGLPWFVVGKNTKKNTLIVSQNEKDLLKKELIAEQVNWISGIEIKLPLQVLAKVRYGAVPSIAIIKEKTGQKKYKVIFAKPQKAITPGQSIVFYLKNELLAGGVIQF
ncbi:MAG: tRNA 2-thiouridine(34) synthase MnmA [Candidatus Pacebacteria bacterium]|nr:tRNA 2-thiouridine(34) synthase MnmA [Candidatus Paceibacterota bacterium]